MAERKSKPFECNKCGTSVVWAESQNGKKYLAEMKVWEGNLYNTMRVFLPSHNCVIDLNYAERKQQQLVEQLERGVIMKGQHITVIAGRKVPKGTNGTIFWVDENAVDYDHKPLQTQRIGFKDNAENVYWIVRKNITATNQLLKKAK